MERAEWPRGGRDHVTPSCRGQDAVITMLFREVFFSRSIAEFIQKPVEKIRAELSGLHLSCKVRFLRTMHLPRALEVVLFHYPGGNVYLGLLVQTKLRC